MQLKITTRGNLHFLPNGMPGRLSLSQSSKTVFLHSIRAFFLFAWFLSGASFGLIAQTGRVAAFDVHSASMDLAAAPAEGSMEEKNRPFTYALPMPKGGQKQFNWVRYDIMNPAFAAQYPGFATYKINAADQSGYWGRATLSPHGMIAHIFTPNGLVEIYPEDFQSPLMHRVQEGPFSRNSLICGFEDRLGVPDSGSEEKGIISNGSDLRNYTFALVTTGEFAQAHGGSGGPVSLVIVGQMAALEAIYEKELAVNFDILPPVIYLNPSTDPFPSTNDDRTLMAAEAVALNWPDFNAYDIGHVLHSSGGNPFWGGGIAYFGLCSNGLVPGSATGRLKAGAWSSVGNSPAGDVSLFAHEVGHQFYMPHTFNGGGSGCQGNIGSTSGYEIGSGTTIMSYNGLCGAGQNIPSGGEQDNYFHTTSLEAAVARMNNTNCAFAAPSGNTPPVVTANPCSGSTTIPKGTPFRITGAGTDADGDEIYYNWEQIDEDGPGAPTQGLIGAAAAASNIAPLFRSFPPSTSPTRFFPSLPLVIANSYDSPFEPLPSVARTIRLQLTGRDWETGGGGIHTATLDLNIASSGPFTVTAPNAAGITAAAGSSLNVTWDVNGTASICDNVNIRLSTDGGYTFPYLLTGPTPNDGAQAVTIPPGVTNTGSARIMIECANNPCIVFFDISNANFTITSDCRAPSTEVSPVTPLALPAGSPGLMLNMTNNIGTIVSSFAGNIASTDPFGQLIFSDGSPAVCAVASNVVNYDTYLFTPDVSGSYTFTLSGPFGLVMNLYQAPFLGPGCTGHIRSSAIRPSGTGSVSLGSSVSATLVAGNQYILMVSSFSVSTPFLPSFYTVNFTKPSGSNIYNGVILPVNYAYTYVAVNTSNNQIIAVSANSDFSSLPPGSYCIYGATYRALGTTPPPVNPSNWINQTIQAVLAGGSCAFFSTNCRPITVTSVTCTPPVVQAPTITQPASCAVPTGTIVVNATGTGALEYSINNGSSWQTSNTFTGVIPGTYNIRVRLQSITTCVTAYSGNPITINPPPQAPVVNAPTVSQPNCVVNTGVITVNATGSGTMEYSINDGSTWQASNVFGGLLPGEYRIRVRFQSTPSCVSTYAGNPVVISASPLPPTIQTPILTQPTCPVPTGTIVVNATGSGALEYSVTNGVSWQSSNTFSGLSAGIYNIRVRLQSSPVCVTVFSGNPLVINPATSAPVVTVPTVTNPTSCAMPTGTIVVNATGTGNLQYSINNGTTWQSSATFSGVQPGNYNIVVRLAADTICSTSFFGNPVVISPAPSAPLVTAPTVTQPSCTVSTGAIIVNATGAGTLEYSINDGASYQSSNSFANLAPGNYFVRVRLVSNPVCNTAFSGNPVVVNVVPDVPTLDPPTVTQPTCAVSTGTIQINSPDPNELEYSINNGLTWQPSNIFAGLNPGSYLIRARIRNNPTCIATYIGNPVVINNAPPGPTVGMPTVTPPTCDTPTGTIVVNATGLGALEYSVNAGATWQTSNVFTGLPPNNYNIRVRLAADPTCSTLYSGNPVVLTPPAAAPVVSAPTVTQPQNCAAPTGTIVVNATGSGVLEYSVNNGLSYQVSNTFPNLVAGNYFIRVRLQANPTCFTSYADNPVVIVPASAAPTISAPIVTDPQTCGVSTGVIIVNATGSGILQYSIDDGVTWQNSNIFTGLAPGNYNIRVRLESNPNCFSIYGNNPVAINPGPSAPTISAPSIFQPQSCTSPTGVIIVNASGNGPLEYSIDNGNTWQLSNFFANLQAGSYFIRVRSQADPSCNAAWPGNPVIIDSAPASPVLDTVLVVHPQTCANPTGSITVIASGPGALQYTINNGSTWQNSNVFTGVAPGSYSVRVRLLSSPFCVVNYTGNPVVINPAPNGPTLSSPTVMHPPNCIITTGSIIVNAFGNSPIEYSITNGATWQSSNFFTGLPPGDYYLRVRFQSDPSCQTVFSGNPVVINPAPVPPTVNPPTVIQPSCTVPTGTIVVNAVGSGVLEYSINNGASWQSSNTFTGLGFGYYTVRARLQNNPTCNAAFAGNPVEISLSLFSVVLTAPRVIQPTCDNATGSIEVNASGPGFLEYSINNGISWQNSSMFNNLPPGSYFIRVRLQNNPSCSVAYSANPVIIEPASSPVVVLDPAVVQPLSCSVPFGAIVVNAIGSGVLEYSIDNGLTYQFSNVFSGLNPGLYYIRVRSISSLGCSAAYVNNPVVIQPAPQVPTLQDPIVVQPSCTFPFGTIIVNASGNGVLQYSINDGQSWQNSSVFNNLPPGNYLIRVRLQTDPVCQAVFSNNPVELFADPNVKVPDVTQPTCSNPFGSITVNASGSTTLEYSINGGITYQASNFFSGLVPGSYNIRVRLQGNPACQAPYAGNPVVISGSSSLPVVEAPVVIQPTCAMPTGSIKVVALGNNVLEYSINQGQTWQESNFFPNLTPGSYSIRVRLRSDPSCQNVFAGNPVVILPPSNCCTTAPVLQCVNRSITFNGQDTLFIDPASLATVTSSGCAIQSITPSPAFVVCDQIGQTISVSITVVDINQNTATCTSLLTIEGLPCGWSQDPDGINCVDGNSYNYNPATGVFSAQSTNCYYQAPFVADALAFARYELCGNGSITAQVTGIFNPGTGWAGIVMRESSAPGARKSQLTTNLINRHRREIRSIPNGQAVVQNLSSQNRYWLRLVRSGNQFISFTSADGVSWFLIGTNVLNMGNCIEVGLVLSGTTPNTTVNATFQNVRVSAVNTILSDDNDDDQWVQLPEQPDFHIAPNPNNGDFRLECGRAYRDKTVRLEILGVEGQVLYSMVWNTDSGQEIPVSLAGLNQGLYFVRLKAEGLPDVTRRVVLQ